MLDEQARLAVDHNFRDSAHVARYDGGSACHRLEVHDAGRLIDRPALVDDYRAALDSSVADLQNIGDPKAHFSGGTITAALFLREFAQNGARPVSWAHLDVAGPSS